MSDIGQRIMEYIIDAGMVRADCVKDKEHGVLSVWSASTAEQIEAMVEEEFKRRSDMSTMFDGIGAVLNGMFILLCVFLPLGIWKAIEIFVWLCNHVSVGVK